VRASEMASKLESMPSFFLLEEEEAHKSSLMEVQNIKLYVYR
jgi:hypothetical protein